MLYSVFNQKVNEFKADASVRGALVVGSFARGTETPYSDLDLVVLASDNKVVEEVVSGVPVESHYRTYEGLIEELKEPKCLYLYAYSKIIFDNSGELEYIVKLAKQKLKDYVVPQEELSRLKHVMSALKEKLNAAINLGNTLKISYLVHNNFKDIVAYLYAINNLPVPPQGFLYEISDNLPLKPCEKWLESILMLKGVALAQFIIKTAYLGEIL